MKIIKRIKEAIKREQASYWKGYYERWPELKDGWKAHLRRERREEEDRFDREWNRSQAFRDSRYE